ncbi:MAG: phage tail tape measure protein, partial [Planctomycetota bacterium]
MFKEFDLTLSKVQATTGASKQEFKELKDLALELGESTKFSANDVATLELELSKLGFSVQQVKDATPAILDFAAASDVELGRAAEVIASTTNAFNLLASDSQRVADVAAKAFASSALDVEKFATAIAIVAPAAEATGTSIEETVAILGKISDAGVDASTAGTALRNIFIDLADKGLTFEQAISQIENSQNKLTTANELFGKRGAVVAKIIADNTSGIADLTKELENSAGAANEAAKIISQNLSGDIDTLNSRFEALLLNQGPLNELFRTIVRGATRLIDVINSLSGAEKEIVKTGAALTDQRIDNIKSIRAEEKEVKGLLNTYEGLVNKQNLTKEETIELERATNRLVGIFGESVAVVDQETSALRVNVEEIKNKIRANALLESEEVKNLLVRQAQLESLLATAQTTEARIAEFGQKLDDSLRSLTITGNVGAIITEEFKQIQKAAEQGGAAIALSTSNIAQLETNLSEAERNQLQAFRGQLNTLRPLVQALSTEASNSEELKKINEELLALGIDFNAVISQQITLRNKNRKAGSILAAEKEDEKALKTFKEIFDELNKVDGLRAQLSAELAKEVGEQRPELIKQLKAEIEQKEKLIGLNQGDAEELRRLANEV